MTPWSRGLVAAGLLGAPGLACDATDIQAFNAGQYLPTLDCVTPEYTIDVISSPPENTVCDAACIIPPFDSGVYVSGQCAPFPPGDLVNPDSSVCTLALAAIHRHDICLDGGPSNPLVDSGMVAPRAEAGASAEAGARDSGSSSDAGPRDASGG